MNKDCQLKGRKSANFFKPLMTQDLFTDLAGVEDLAGDWRRLDERIETLWTRSKLLRARMPIASD